MPKQTKIAIIYTGGSILVQPERSARITTKLCEGVGWVALQAQAEVCKRNSDS